GDADLPPDHGDHATRSDTARGHGRATIQQVDLASEAGQIVRLSFVAGAASGARVERPVLRGVRFERPPTAPQPTRTGDSAHRPNILLYIVDTLRADHLGCYGYGLPTSPHIDALAAQGILWTNVVAQAPWTKPATASILTGVDPLVHQATRIAARLS